MSAGGRTMPCKREKEVNRLKGIQQRLYLHFPGIVRKFTAIGLHLKEELKHVQKNEPFLSGLIFTDPGIALLDIFIRQILVILIRMMVQNSKLDLILKSSLSYMCKWYFATINILIFFN
ncbi:uncharacterized protein LOC134718910 [Mytilus trossulus]|uniref:uncharacterized protein LOC134718910 n=1 Tax=Mytilus trossulus TaxID=6551 RepID=UPI003004BB55